MATPIDGLTWSSICNDDDRMCRSNGEMKIFKQLQKRHDLSPHDFIMAQQTTQRSHKMFWTFLMMTGLALVFAQLGAYSVLVAVLAGGLKLALLIIAGFVIVLFWRKVFQKNT
jgi:hypothetical protein